MSWNLIFPDASFSRLRAELLAQAPQEAGAILLCNHGGLERLLVEEIRVAGPQEYCVQAADRLEFEPGFVAAALKVARDRKQALILTHTHPFSDEPQFSMADDFGEARLFPSIYARSPEGPHGALVVGTAGFQARLQVKGAYQQLSRVTEVGREVLPHERTTDHEPIAGAFDRNVLALGVVGQQRLHRLTVAIVGLGGTGSLVAQELAHLGIGRMLLIDPDRLEPTNLNRVVGATPHDVGRSKVEIAKDQVSRISGGKIDTKALIGNVLDENIGRDLLGCDLVFSCTDTHGSRALINQIAYQYLVPAIDMGVRLDVVDGHIRAMAARVQMLAPGLPCLQCHPLLDAEEIRRDFLSEAARRVDPYIVGASVPQPAVISFNGVTSSIAITMLLSVFAGLAVPARWVNYRIGESLLRPVSTSPNPACVVCSQSHGALAKGEQWPLFWRPRS